jgi:hypothetical protein
MFFFQPSSTRMCAAHEPVQYIYLVTYFVRSDWIRLLFLLRHNVDDVIRRRASARNFFHQHESESTWPLFISFLRPAKAADKFFSPVFPLYTQSTIISRPQNEHGRKYLGRSQAHLQVEQVQSSSLRLIPPCALVLICRPNFQFGKSINSTTSSGIWIKWKAGCWRRRVIS